MAPRAGQDRLATLPGGTLHSGHRAGTQPALPARTAPPTHDSRPSMHVVSITTAADRQRARRAWAVAWVGGAPGIELAWCREATAGLVRVSDVAVPESPDRDPPDGARLPQPRTDARTDARMDPGGTADGGPPTVVVLATDAPGRWRIDDAIVLARRWPLAVIVAVATTLSDGRRRSGPPLPGIEEIAWHEFPARLCAWLADLDLGLPGVLGLPAAARREDRLLQAADAVARWRGRLVHRVSVAAVDRLGVEGLADEVAALGHGIASRVAGRPPVDVPSDVVLWEVSVIDAAVLSWLRLLASQQPGRRIVVVEAFPRGDGVLAALRAGAAAVLGRPLGLEALAGALLMQSADAAQTALGTPRGAR